MKVHGLLLLDKPAGLSSNTALQRARRLMDADKAGHGGTLDPLASGLLPVLLGEACKLAGSALDGDKAYEATVRLGTTTTTDDAEGSVVTEQSVGFEDPARGAELDAAIEAILPSFRGEITQAPPIYSALKIAGKALYRYAREGTPVQASPRRVTIHSIEVRGRVGSDLRVVVACSKGTYVRSIARDLGAALGCGAHLAALRRTRVGRFDVAASVGLEALAAIDPSQRAARLVPLEALVADWPSVTIDAGDAVRFSRGQIVVLPGPLAAAERIAVHSGGRLIGLARLAEPAGALPALAPARVIVA